MQESTGRIFSISPTADLVVEYGSDGSKLREFKVGGEPVELLIKGSRLIVGCKKSTAMYVIDLTKNEVQGSVSVEGKGPYALFCSKVDNSYAYCISNTGSAWWDGEVFQIDLQAMNIRKRVKIQRWGQSHALHVAMSADGKWIVPDARGASSPSGADLMAMNEEECTFTQTRDHHQSFGQMVAGPNGRFWTFGNSLYPLDITASLRKFTGSPVAIHPQLNLAVSLESGASLVFESFSDATSLKRITLPTETNSTTYRSNKFNPILQYDLVNHRVFLGMGRQAFLVDMKKIGVNFQPLLLVSAPSSKSVTIGGTLDIPLKITNSKLAPQTTFQIQSGPDGAKIVNHQLVWKPTNSQIGPHEILVEAVNGTLKDVFKVQVSVEIPKLKFNFAIRGTMIDAAGEYMAIWGPKRVAQGTRSSYSSTAPVEFAMIKLADRSIIDQRPLAAGLKNVLIDDKYLYLIPASSNVLYRMNRENMGDPKRLFLNEPVVKLFKSGTNTISVMGSLNHRQSITSYDRETLKKTSENLSSNISISSQSISKNTPLSATHSLIQQKIVDSKNGDFLYTTWAAQLPSLANTTARMPSIGNPISSSRETPKVWGRKLMNSTLTNHSGSRIANWSGMVNQMSLKYPIAVSIRNASVQRASQTFLDIRELEQGQIIHSSLINVKQIVSSGSSYSHFTSAMTTRLRIVGDQVIYADGESLLFINLPTDILAKVTPPFHFLLPGKSVYSEDKAVKISLQAKGGKGAPTYSLAYEYPGISLNEKSGELSLDIPSMWKTFMEALPAKQKDFRTGRTLTTKLSDNAKYYQEITGQKLPAGKMALSLPIIVTAVDDEGQQDQLNYYAIVLADRTELDKANALLAKAETERRAKLQLEAEKRQVEQAAMREAQAIKAAETAKAGGTQIQALEERVILLEATLKVIVRKLEALEQKQ
ncbi:MAG: hypothetical protein COA78_32630 [Blastopirellula sp.]|nr:MAG: hypothetical protein COA78_32630 [Blastopirellula sp.]